MDKLKGKYEVILGFVTLVVSLSAFKEELAKVEIDLGYITISLADYFLFAVYGFAICLYLYIVEHIVRETKIGSWKIFDYLIWIAFILFAFILLTPILLIVNILVVKIYYATNHRTVEESETFFSFFSIVISLLSGVMSIFTSVKLYKDRKIKLQEDFSEQEIFELENAIKLFKDGYYSHSVLESFKVLETHLYKKLTDKNYRVIGRRINDIIPLAVKNGIINERDVSLINDLRGMRNAAAHTDVEYTKQQAEFALDFVMELFKRNGINKVRKEER